MSFDKDSNRPAVNFRKWTTKVNLWLIGGVLLFLGAGTLILLWSKITFSG